MDSTTSHGGCASNGRASFYKTLPAVPYGAMQHPGTIALGPSDTLEASCSGRSDTRVARNTDDQQYEKRAAPTGAALYSKYDKAVKPYFFVSVQ